VKKFIYPSILNTDMTNMVAVQYRQKDVGMYIRGSPTYDIYKNKI